MKKVLLMTMLSLFTVVVFASDPYPVEVSYTVKKHFENDFKNAENVVWTLNQRCLKAKFKVSGNDITAFYSLQGEYLGASQVVKYVELPLAARLKIEKDYAGYKVNEALQIISRPHNVDVDDTGFYAVGLIGDERRIYLRVTLFADVLFCKEIKAAKNHLAQN